jgi:hypothetical protein
MKGPMKVIDASSGLMECKVCGSSHHASLQSGQSGLTALLDTAVAAINAAMNNARPTRKNWTRVSSDTTNRTGGSWRRLRLSSPAVGDGGQASLPRGCTSARW